MLKDREVLDVAYMVGDIEMGQDQITVAEALRKLDDINHGRVHPDAYIKMSLGKFYVDEAVDSDYLITGLYIKV